MEIIAPELSMPHLAFEPYRELHHLAWVCTLVGQPSSLAFESGPVAVLLERLEIECARFEALY